jgi:hypothetical protein
VPKVYTPLNFRQKIGTYWEPMKQKDILQGIFDLKKNLFAKGIPDLFSLKIKWVFKSTSRRIRVKSLYLFN